jgi:hypothetical protein
VWGSDVEDLPGWVHCVLHTQEFARLHELKQTGYLYLSFADATHSRAEHSVGVASRAWAMVRALQTAQPELGVTDAMVYMATLAGLCHDMGHGPGSHSFEEFMKAMGASWDHENQTIKMLRGMMARNPQLSSHLMALGVDLELVCRMVLGMSPPDGWPSAVSWLFQVVHNKASGLDVDKMDYIPRDWARLRLPSPMDSSVWRTLVHDVRAVPCVAPCTCSPGGAFHLSWPVESADAVRAVFEGRAQLHLQAYQQAEPRSLQAVVTQHLVDLNDLAVLPDGKTLMQAAQAVDISHFIHATDVVLEKGLHCFSTTLVPHVLVGVHTWDMHTLAEQPAPDIVAAVTAKLWAEAVGDQQALVTKPAFVDLVSIHGGQGPCTNPVPLVPLHYGDLRPAPPSTQDITRLLILRVYKAAAVS